MARKLKSDKILFVTTVLLVAAGLVVLVAVAASHRGAAFKAAEMLMDYLKTRAPFWKRAIRADGAAEGWIEAKGDDDRSAARWSGAD